jgi:serine/threonine protein kinase
MELRCGKFVFRGGLEWFICSAKQHRQTKAHKKRHKEASKSQAEPGRKQWLPHIDDRHNDFAAAGIPAELQAMRPGGTRRKDVLPRSLPGGQGDRRILCHAHLPQGPQRKSDGSIEELLTLNVPQRYRDGDGLARTELRRRHTAPEHIFSVTPGDAGAALLGLGLHEGERIFTRAGVHLEGAQGNEKANALYHCSFPFFSYNEKLPMSQSFGKYQLTKKLATGGMAEVWLANQTGIEGFNRHVVIKRILPHLAEDPEFVQMFLNEAKTASRFTHPNIGQIYDLGEQGGTYYIAMEFIHGEDLGRVMRRALSTGQWIARHIAIRIVADSCQGLYYAYSRNDEQGRPLRVVHRDISPQNILISFDGAVKIVDFGIAKAADQVSMTKSGAIKGKFAYMAPEQASGKLLDGRTDIFALGLVLYELVTCVRPLKRDTELGTLQAALECSIEPPSHVAEVPHELDDIIMRALAKDPEERYRDAREFQKALDQFLLDSKELATNVEISELMETLFADRLAEEARLGTLNPATESSTSNPVAAQPNPFTASFAAAAPLRPPPRPNAPSATMDEEAGPVTKERPQSTSFSRPQSLDAAAELEPVEDSPARPSRQAVRKLAPGAAKRRGTSAAMQSATRRSRAQMRAGDSDEDMRAPLTSDGISKLVDIKGMRNKARSRLILIIGAVVLIGGGILGVTFWPQIRDGMKLVPQADDGVPIRLTVSTNPPTEVWVIPGKNSNNRQKQNLGHTMLTEAAGAFVGDTIMLINEERGINFPVEIARAEPNELKTIEKVFKEHAVKVRSKPIVKGGEVWRASTATKLGQLGISLGLYPGVHQLEIRATALAVPVPFEIDVQDGQRIFETEIDVTSGLEKPGQE